MIHTAFRKTLYTFKLLSMTMFSIKKRIRLWTINFSVMDFSNYFVLPRSIKSINVCFVSKKVKLSIFCKGGPTWISYQGTWITCSGGSYVAFAYIVRRPCGTHYLKVNFILFTGGKHWYTIQCHKSFAIQSVDTLISYEIHQLVST